MKKFFSFLLKVLNKNSYTLKFRMFILNLIKKKRKFYHFFLNFNDIFFKFDVWKTKPRLKTIKNKTIHCIGDSHVSFFAGYDKIQDIWYHKTDQKYTFLKVYRLGPILAYNLCKRNTTNKGREQLFYILSYYIPRGSRILFCFGEIDCRAHLLNQSKLQGRPIEEIVKECVERYFLVINKVKKKGYEILVSNVIPSAPDITKVKDLKSFPYYGTYEERNNVTCYFNNYLKQKLEKANIFFLNIFDELLNENKEINQEFLFDGFHLAQKAMPLVLKKIIEQYPEYGTYL